MITALTLLAGLFLLVLGGELLVRGSVRVAERLGVSPLLIGITLVGFGTSTPELVTSVQAASIGSSGIAVGNIVGSNIANVLLILGISALLVPLAVQSRALARDGVVTLASAALLTAVAWSTGLSRPVGLAFVALLIGYMIYAYRQERVAAGDHTAAFDKAEAATGVDPALAPQERAGSSLLSTVLAGATALAGLAIIIVGARLLVDSAVDLARLIGLSETVIGLTIVSVGTSMPELVTCVVAAMKRQSDVAIGSILGSNIYNTLGIGGVTALVAPTEVPDQIARLDAPLMVAVSLLLLVFARTGSKLSRWEGGVFVGLYAAYLGWLIWSA
jgi:cation:H+ antiporter